MQLCSEVFNLSVKRLSRGISGTIDEIVEYFSLSISNGCGNSTEILVPKILYLLNPFIKTGTCRILAGKLVANYHSERMRQRISFLKFRE